MRTTSPSRTDVVVLCTSILSTETVLSHLPVQRLRRSTLFVDVLSVKQFPKRLLLSTLPDYFDILCTHPMFGPESGKNGWQGLTFMYDPVRVNAGAAREERVANFLRCFEAEGCEMVPMTCEEHDRHAASSQFITHTVGRMLGRLDLESTPVDTKGYQTLLDLVDNTANDSFELYYGLFMYNARCEQRRADSLARRARSPRTRGHSDTQRCLSSPPPTCLRAPARHKELDRLEKAFDGLKKQLFDQLHDKLRGQLFLDPRDPNHESNASTTEASPPRAPAGRQRRGG